MNRGSRPETDRLSAETYHALLDALTIIRAQAQMAARLAHRTTAADADVVLRRLGMVEQVVDRMVRELDTLPVVAGSEEDAAANGSGPARNGSQDG